MSGLQLHLYNDRELTDKEITLQKFFEDRDREHQRKLEMKQRKRLSSVDDFLQVGLVLPSRPLTCLVVSLPSSPLSLSHHMPCYSP